MKTNLIGTQQTIAQYVFADIAGIDFQKWFRRLFWMSIHAMTLFFMVSLISSYTGFGSYNSNARSPQPITEVKSAIAFPVHETAPDPNVILDAVNEYRRTSGLPQLIADASLSQLAETRAKDMTDRAYYAHKNPDGYIFYDLMANKPQFACENLSLESSADPTTSVASWISSTKGHKECLLNESVSLAGYASVKMYDASVNGVMQPYFVVVAIHSTEN